MPTDTYLSTNISTLHSSIPIISQYTLSHECWKFSTRIVCVCAQNHSDHLTFKLLCISFSIFADFQSYLWLFHHALHIRQDAHTTILFNDNTDCSSSHTQHSLLILGCIYAGFQFAMLLCILHAVYKKKMYVGSGMPNNSNVLTQELLHGFCENLEQTHTSQNSYFF